MGRPYDHQYFFAGSGGICGDMVCRKCGQPIFSHSQDWMAYKKSKSYDWSYHCFHRKCRDNQSGWESVEHNQERAKEKFTDIQEKFKSLANEIGVNFDESLADAAADAVGIDLDEIYFNRYGSC